MTAGAQLVAEKNSTLLQVSNIIPLQRNINSSPKVFGQASKN